MLSVPHNYSGQTTADRHMVTNDNLKEVDLAVSHRTITDPLHALPISHNTAQLAYHSASCPFKVIQGRLFLPYLKKFR